MDEIAQLRAALQELPETAAVVIEDHHNRRFEIVKAFAIGTGVNDPGLVLRIREIPHPLDIGTGV